MKKIPISIGVMAYNEENNIAFLLESIEKQVLSQTVIREIIVISSGSTDRTNYIIKKFINKNARISLLIQRQREGKASAVNLFLSKAREEIIVLVSADVYLPKYSLENLIAPFKDHEVGMVGSRPIPTNNKDSLMGYCAHLLYDLQHLVSLKEPRTGEMIGFRKIFKKIPNTTAVDEASIEPLILGQGYNIVYAPKAVVVTKGPESLNDYILRRRRVYAGHLKTKNGYGYEVSTLNGFKIIPLIIKQANLSWQFIIYTPIIIFLEVVGRLLGYLDYKFNLKNHTVWTIARTTKKLFPG